MRMSFMGLMVFDTSGYIDAQTEATLTGALEQLGLDFKIIKCCGCERFCIASSADNDICKRYCCSSGTVVQTINKDICRIYPYEILYIAIEDRKSVLYLINGKIETHYSMNHWKDCLDENFFAQPHYSYLVNLNYVTKVTKDFVTLRYGEVEYKVYTSSRKLCAFKKAVLEFGETKVNK